MDLSETSLKRFRPPTSGSIIGVLAALIENKPAGLKTKQARRFLAGEIVSPQQRRRAIYAFATALVESGPLPSAAFKSLPLPPQEALATVIAWHAEQWDRLGAYVYSNSGRVHQEKDALLAYLRLIVVDLAIRGIALLWLIDAPEPEEKTPAWAKKFGVAHNLRRLLTEAGFTRDTFAEAVAMSERAVDTWLDEGVRPQASHIERIAIKLGERLQGRSLKQLKEEMSRGYCLSGIADLLAELIGRPSVEMLARALCVLITRVLPDLRCIEPTSREDGMAIQVRTLLLGCSGPRAKHLLDLMWRGEGNKEWRIDIQAAKVDWVQRLQLQISKRGSPDSRGPVMHRSTAAQLAKRAVEEIAANSFEALAEGDHTVAKQTRLDAVRIYNAALTAAPTDAWLHFQLGSILGEIEEVDEAVRECWLAASLEPGWDLPLAEIGVIYFNAGRVEEAKQHLETIARQQPHPSWNILLNLGLARMRTGDAAGGLEALEKALDIETNHPIILKAAAECALLLGQKIKARRYSKRAQLLGT